jgi:hypothetical protein
MNPARRIDFASARCLPGSVGLMSRTSLGLALAMSGIPGGGDRDMQVDAAWGWSFRAHFGQAGAQNSHFPSYDGARRKVIITSWLELKEWQ